MALLDSVFIRVLSTATLDERIRKQQHAILNTLVSWRNAHALVQKEDRSWYKGRALVVSGGDQDKRELLQLYHNTQVVGHPGVAKTLWMLSRDYWWPGMRTFMQEYVKGCSKCQESKSRTHPNWPPIQPITPAENTRPFATIAMDFIVKLPPSQGYDSILMVTNHDCTKVIILLPCKEEMDSLGFAKLYLERIFPFIGLPERVISDQDPRFTSKIFREICTLLEVKQNIASGYHPQTDRQSEKMNQHVETAIQIFGNYQQDCHHCEPLTIAHVGQSGVVSLMMHALFMTLVSVKVRVAFPQ